MKNEPIIGCILGTAVGDALGLPYEGLSPERATCLFPKRDSYHFILGRGMVSDDTEHTCFVAEALLSAKGDPDRFEKHLARSFRHWLIGLPAGVGLATLKSIIRLWLGFSPARSGVFSAGNGPSMRSALLGVVYGNRPDVLRKFVMRAIRITHSDPKAYYGALTVALAAYRGTCARHTSPADFVGLVAESLSGEAADEFIDLIQRAARSAEKHESLSEFTESIGCSGGISGYTYHSIPCVIQTWLRFQRDYRSAVLEMISAGGDTDTTAAIVGAIVGACVGKAGIPEPWLSGLIEWPRTMRWMEDLGDALAKGLDNGQGIPPRVFFPGILLRNVALALIVLFHGFRRLMPPY